MDNTTNTLIYQAISRYKDSIGFELNGYVAIDKLHRSVGKLNPMVILSKIGYEHLIRIVKMDYVGILSEFSSVYIHLETMGVNVPKLKRQVVNISRKVYSRERSMSGATKAHNYIPFFVEDWQFLLYLLIAFTNHPLDKPITGEL